MASPGRSLLKQVLVSELCDDSEIHRVDMAEVAQACAIVLNEEQPHDMPLNEVEDRTENPDAHVANFVEVTVPSYTTYQFKSHFRMYPQVFEAFLAWVAPSLSGEISLTREKKLFATLWLISNKESYRSVADRFGMNKGTLHHIVMNVCRVLTSLREDVIKWPERHQLQRMAERWQQRAGFPDVVGAIGGTYIKIPGPTDETRDSFICRKGYPAMHLQVVCGNDLRFLHVTTGNVGSVHDSRVFRTSDLKTFLESDEGCLPSSYHLLGDSAYVLQQYLLVPFRDNGHLTRMQKVYNKAHAQTRVEVERSIGLLKGKFRRLKDLEMLNSQEIPHVIFASCVVHNFIIQNNGADEDDIVMSSSDEEDEGTNSENAMSAEDKRMSIAHMLA